MSSEEYYKKYPNLKKSLDEFPNRFNNPRKETDCDNGCGRKLTPTTFSVFVTPAPEHNALFVCQRCLQELYLKHNLTSNN